VPLQNLSHRWHLPDRHGLLLGVGSNELGATSWDSAEAAEAFFSEELRERIIEAYRVPPTVAFVEIAQIVDKARA